MEVSAQFLIDVTALCNIMACFFMVLQILDFVILALGWVGINLNNFVKRGQQWQIEGKDKLAALSIRNVFKAAYLLQVIP